MTNIQRLTLFLFLAAIGNLIFACIDLAAGYYGRAGICLAIGLMCALVACASMALQVGGG